MGVGLPYAMGVKLDHPDADVDCVTGEGSIQMCIQELSTCQQYRLPVIILADEVIGHMNERVVIPREEEIEISNRRKPTVSREG